MARGRLTRRTRILEPVSVGDVHPPRAGAVFLRCRLAVLARAAQLHFQLLLERVVTDEVVPESEWTYDVSALAASSQLIAALLQLREPLQYARPINRVTRGPDDVKRGDWVVVRQHDSPSRVGQVREMMQCVAPGVPFSVIRLWCEKVKQAHDDEINSVMWAASGDSAAKMVVYFEKMHVEVVVHSLCSIRDEFL